VRTSTRGRKRCFGTGVATTDYNDIEGLGVLHSDNFTCF
jgi:hypothetical protein